MTIFGVSLTEMLVRVPAALIAIAVHEACHGFAAYKLGDPTPKYQGRLTLNPFAHLDFLGTICLILFRFGWAKPVQIDASHFKNPKQGMALTALAGPMSNFLLSFLALFLAHVCTFFPGAFADALIQFLLILTVMSLGLGIFNLIPIPPLDGSKMLWVILPNKWVNFLARYEQYAIILLILGMYFGLFTRPLGAALGFVFDLYSKIFALIF